MHVNNRKIKEQFLMSGTLYRLSSHLLSVDQFGIGMYLLLQNIIVFSKSWNLVLAILVISFITKSSVSRHYKLGNVNADVLVWMFPHYH